MRCMSGSQPNITCLSQQSVGAVLIDFHTHGYCDGCGAAGAAAAGTGGCGAGAGRGAAGAGGGAAGAGGGPAGAATWPANVSDEAASAETRPSCRAMSPPFTTVTSPRRTPAAGLSAI